MNKIMKKIYLSVLTLGLTVVALGTTTFAWFTLTNQAQVQQFELNVITDDGIEVRLARPFDTEAFGAFAPEERWVTTLTTQMMQDYILGAYTSPVALRGITSTDGIIMRDVENDEVANDLGQYLTFRLDFRSNSIQEVRWLNVVLTSSGVPFVPNVPFIDTTGTLRQPQSTSIGNAFAANATRISVQGTSTYVYELDGEDYGDTVSSFGANTVLGGFSGDLSVELNPAHDPLVDTDPLDPSYEPPFVPNPLRNGMLSYFYAVTNTDPDNVDSVSVVSTIQELDNELVLNMTGDSLSTGFTYSGSIIIRIWIEGWDPDMYNSILADQIQVSLRFGTPTTP